MNKYLFLFTIGPVQSFISQARKTQDLNAGSKLLSYLINFAMGEIKNLADNCEFIFPVESKKSTPNRFIAIVESNNPEEIGKDLESNVRKKLREIANKIFSSVPRSTNDTFLQKFNNQINDFFQIFWVALPFDDTKYLEIYPKIERFLGAVKNVKMFNQLEEVGRKCSLCGERNALFYKKTTNGKVPSYIDNNAIDLEIPVKLANGEGLCAICFVKRFGDQYFNDKDTKDFPSTAKIAILSWLENIPKEKQNEFKSCFKNFDEQLYYEENLEKKYLERDSQFKGEVFLANAKKLLNEFYKIKIKGENGNEKELGKPPKYYALIMFDGDNMGKWLSGEFLEDKSKLIDFHKEISKSLGNYADRIEKIITFPKGRWVYAGGDDVLAFINLKYLFEVLRELRENFPKFEELGFDVNGNKSSASCGVVIAHYKTPLSEVLKWTRKMEKEAKEKGSRDAFAIAVLKHSGEIHKTVWKWNLDNGDNTILLYEKLIKELQDEETGFSNNFIKALNIECQKLSDLRDSMIKTELKRLLNRSSFIKNDKIKKEEKVQEWQEKLFDIYLEAGINNKNNFLSFLNISDFLKRKQRGE